MPDKGHRRRLRGKFLKSGFEGFHDYEIVELLLTLAQPMKDCKPMAKAALRKFGSSRAVLEAYAKELSEVKGLGPNNIFGLRLARDIARRYLAERIEGKDFLQSSQEVMDYLKVSLRDRSREVFMVIYLNGRNQIMSMEEVFEGTLTTSVVYPREVVKQALNHEAAALIFVHNHPSGNPQPSKDDLEITKKLKDAVSTIDVSIHDHIIIAGDETYSFADHGLI